MDTLNKNFKVWLDKRLKKRRWSIRELSRRSSFTFGHIANVARGVKPVTFEVVADLACTFGEKPEDAFYEVGLLPYQKTV